MSSVFETSSFEEALQYYGTFDHYFNCEKDMEVLRDVVLKAHLKNISMYKFLLFSKIRI